MNVLRFTNAIFIVASLCLKSHLFLASFMLLSIFYRVIYLGATISNPLYLQKKDDILLLMPSFLTAPFTLET